MHKNFEDTIDFLPDVTPRQQIVAVRPKILPGLYDWLRFGESREDWVELFGLNLEQIDEQAAAVYLEGEKKYFGRFRGSLYPGCRAGTLLRYEAGQTRIDSGPLHSCGHAAMRQDGRWKPESHRTNYVGGLTVG